MAERTFTFDEQQAFARLSGDYNPLHMSPVIARRLLFGRQIVHGLHALLWGMDAYLRTRAHRLEFRAVKASFQAGIGLGETVDCTWVDQRGHQTEMRLGVDGTPVMWIQIDWSPSTQEQAGPTFQSPGKPWICRERCLEEALAASGSVPLYLDLESAASLFPNLMRHLPPMQLAALLSTTRLVGMECPGLHSIYSGLDLEFFPDRDSIPELSYDVSVSNRRLGMLLLDVRAPGMRGKIKTFLRPAPQGQIAFTDACREVESGEFSQQRALIIGGSRGLGEIAAKLLAAGGAEVYITYYRGEHDAKRVVDEIIAHGGKADCFPWNILEPVPMLPIMLGGDALKPLYVYYFATPFIFGGVKGKFSSKRFSNFSEYYVTGFLRTVQTLATLAGGLQKIFYPSSTAIDELPLDMGEYAAAKLAGELACDFLQKATLGLAIHKPRLPRVATDQTVSLLPVKNQDPLPVLLAQLRQFRNLTPYS